MRKRCCASPASTRSTKGARLPCWSSFGITTVGEWVGDEKTAKMLEKAGISYMQGYFFGAPELTKPEVAAKPAG